MPILKVELFADRTAQQKAEFAEKVTLLASQVFQCPFEVVDVIFVDVERSNWAHAGKLYSTD